MFHLMNKVLCLIFLSFLTILCIFILCLHLFIKSNPRHIDFRIILLCFMAFGCFVCLIFNTDKVPFYICNGNKYTTYSLSALFIFYISPILHSFYKLVKSYRRQKLLSFFEFTLKQIKSQINHEMFIQIFVYSAIEEIIFRATFCNLMLYSSFSIKETVLISATLYSLSKLYYMFTSPAFLSNGMSKLVKRTLFFMFTSFLFGLCTSYIYCKSHSFHAIYIINAYYNYIDNPLNLKLWNSASKSPFQVFIRLTLVFGYVYLFSIILMFATSNSL